MGTKEDDNLIESKIENERITKERDMLKMALKTLSNYNNYLHIVGDYNDFCEKTIYEILDSEKSVKEKFFHIFRNIHTFKNCFLHMDMNNMVEKLYQFECELNNIKENIEELENKEFSEFIISKNMGSWIESDITILKKLLGEKFININDIAIVDKRKLIQIEKRAKALLTPIEKKVLIPEIKALTNIYFKELLRMYPNYIKIYTLKQNVKIHPIVIEGEDILVDAGVYFNFARSLINIFTNIVDHGIESEEERILRGKDPIGTITCRMFLKGDRFHLEIGDDGRGLDYEKIKEKLVENGYKKKEDLIDINEDSLKYYIFKEGFSTCDDITVNSGSGLGLYTVKKEIENIKGEIIIDSEKEKGLDFHFIIPYEKVSNLYDIETQEVIEPLYIKIRDIYENEFGFQLVKNGRFINKIGDRIKLREISGFLNIKGVINGQFILSVDDELVTNMVKNFVFEELSEEEAIQYKEDVLAEYSNLILGGVIKSYGEIEEFIGIDTPSTVHTKGGNMIYDDSDIWVCDLKYKQGEVTIGFIIPCTNLIKLS